MVKEPIHIANELYKGYKSINRQVKYINYGGCGAFAEHLYNVLVMLGLKPILGVITGHPKGMVARIKAWEKYGIKGDDYYYKGEVVFGCIEHIVIILKGKLIDSEGIYDKVDEISDYRGKYYQLTYPLSIEVLRLWNNTGGFWNDSFDRRNIKVIEKKLKECYKKVKKDLVVLK